MEFLILISVVPNIYITTNIPNIFSLFGVPFLKGYYFHRHTEDTMLFKPRSLE